VNVNGVNAELGAPVQKKTGHLIRKQKKYGNRNGALI